MNNKDNVTIGLPKPGGAIFWAPAGTALPTDATSALPAEYVNLGYVTEDGLTVSTGEEGDDINVWGPEVIARSNTSYSKTFTFNLVETARVAVLQFLYGKDNVTIGVGGELEYEETGDPLPKGILVCDTLQNNGSDAPRIKRQIVGDARFTDRSGDNVYNNSDLLAFPVSVSAYKTTHGGTKRSYVKTYISAPIEPESL